ncbi:hypothetical protein Ahy_B07g086984 [Arachis hypogaea]|uniref:Small ribosomal subunit protein uS2c n=1 Tax=Arachis hypogaea TaxID=3818 RepID=A0A444YB36_ARAHY|nr:hypothetical protein Ahy_B07g086984 [Arachis hypogaea]
MAPYIYTKRNGIHILNLTRTARFLSKICDLVFDATSKGKQFLIVGTKNKAADLIARAATRARCHYVNKKWLGGMLTNWYTTETRLHKFRSLRTEETYLGGIKYIVIIVDQQEEYTALRECITLGISTIFLIDTNCDPDLADISIPANDDAIASIRSRSTSLLAIKGVLSACPSTYNFLGLVRNLQTIPTFGQNFFEYVLQFIRDVSKTQIGKEYGPWLPHGELAAPTNDINTTVALALLTSVAYFYAGLSKKELAYFGKYIQPTPILLPINMLEDFTKPLSLSFRLFRNILVMN